VLDFTVAGDTAMLSNAPLTCSMATDAGMLGGAAHEATL